jgi:small subunit ribosomal protein S1
MAQKIAHKESKESMESLAKEWGNRLIPIREGDIVSVSVVGKSRQGLSVDVLGIRMGLVPIREYSKETPEPKIGERAFASIVSLENDEGYVVLSLRRADKERIVRNLKAKYEQGDTVKVAVLDANFGGLICEYGGVQGFLPVSQLSLAHYPRVGTGSKEGILPKLKGLVGEVLSVKILSVDPIGPRVIFSEKAAGDTVQDEELKKLKVGDTVSGVVTGVVEFGLFVNLGLLEGLAHASEVSWDKNKKPGDLYKVGDPVKAQVVSLEKGRVSLSIKRLDPKPWILAAKKLKKGDQVSGIVSKVTPFGAFVQLSPMLDGLVHITELGKDITDPRSVVKEGDRLPFKVTDIDTQAFKISLSLKEAASKKPKGKKKK